MPTPKPNTNIISEREVRTEISSTGEEHTTILEKTKAKEHSTEPDYIKVYTDMWCTFNSIPERYRALFMELATRMSYANSTDLDNSQIVYTGRPISDAICKALGWKQKDSLMKGLRALCDCHAIKKIARAVYQINPSYAGKGEWKYNPRLDRGGVEDLKATFDFKSGTVHTQIIWSDNAQDSELNIAYRAALDTSPTRHDRAVLSEITKQANTDNLEPPPEGEPPEEPEDPT